MNFLIIDEMHPSLFPMLEALSIQYLYKPEIKADEVLQIIGEYEGIVIRSKMKLDKSFIEKASKLKYVCRAGAGLDGIDIVGLEAKNVTLISAPEANRDAVGEHTIGMLLCLMNKLHIADQEVRNGIWHREANRGYELFGKTVGIIGYGNMGKAFAKRLSGFGCKVIMYDKFHPDKEDEYAKYVPMETIFKEADVLSLHTPLTSETKGLVNADYITKFAKPIWFINTSRGEVAVLQDVIDSINNGKIIGACLDVLENEKLNTLTDLQKSTFEQTIHHPKVLLSPHVAGWTFESYEKINQVLIDKLKISINNNSKA
jgi:D-3-phosphoglycerate dehydrogenase